MQLANTLLHGRTLSAGNIEFTAPWISTTDPLQGGFSLSSRSKRSGAFSVLVTYDPRFLPMKPEDPKKAMAEPVHVGLTLTGNRRELEVSGMKLDCIEYEGRTRGTFNYGDLVMECYGRDSNIFISFDGKPDRLPDFEHFLATARLVSR